MYICMCGGAVVCVCAMADVSMMVIRCGTENEIDDRARPGHCNRITSTMSIMPQPPKIACLRSHDSLTCNAGAAFGASY